ncbi:MAG TPA: NUDIX hydrolase [Caulobacteraceae bacterium]|jgi:8-oxo-dGTP pyrophosphatase MutT (NUDIX family)|nr:NUDIX hydrolase [Caulobacteraceae bacterium]
MSQKPAWMKPVGRGWDIEAGRTAFENPWLILREYRCRAPTGHPASYGVVSFKNFAIAILPLHDNGDVTLVGQHRMPLGDYSWELPEGGGPIGVDPLESAKRELREEAGLLAADWQEVLRFQLSNSVTDERGFGFIATELSATETEPDETEALQIVRRPFREALALATSGEMPDAMTVAMLLRAYHMAHEGQLPGALAEAMLSSVR